MPCAFSSNYLISPITHHLTSSYITSPHHSSLHLISPDYHSSALISPHLMPSHLLSHFTLSHVMTSDPTLPHLILKLALKSIITSTKNMVCKKVNLAHRSTKQVGPCTIIQVSIPMGQPVFEKKHILIHILFSSGCLQTVIRILGIKRIPP